MFHKLRQLHMHAKLHTSNRDCKNCVIQAYLNSSRVSTDRGAPEDLRTFVSGLPTCRHGAVRHIGYFAGSGHNPRHHVCFYA